MATAKKASAKGSAKGSAKASGKKAGTVTGGRTLTVKVAPGAKILKVGIGIEKAFKQAGCPGCRSGIDRIVFQDPVLRNVE